MINYRDLNRFDVSGVGEVRRSESDENWSECDENKFYVNEPNTCPGSLSFYLWKEAGMKYSELLDEMVSIAIKEYKHKNQKTMSFKSSIFDGFNGSKGLKGMKGLKN